MITIPKCCETVEACEAKKRDRRKEDRDQLARELQNIHAAISANNEKTNTLSEAVARLTGVVEARLKLGGPR